VLVGKYEVVQHVASGGFGDVYEARDLNLQRPVAIKLLQQRFTDHDDVKNSFFQEARALARLRNPHVVEVYDVGSLGDRIWIAMEFLEGRTLRDELEEDEVFDVARALKYTIAVLGAIAAAHEQGIVHRDVKPENVFVDGERVLLGDFGTAKVLSAARPHAHKVVGTAGYMSPEQTRLEPVDARSDLYAVGLVLYEMLAGRSALVVTPGMGLDQVLSLHLKGPTPLDQVAGWIPANVAAIVAKAIRVRPDKRFQTALQMQVDCQAALENLVPGTPSVRPLAGAEPQPDGLGEAQGRAAPAGPGRPMVMLIGGKRVRVGSGAVVAALALAVLLGAIAAALVLSWLDRQSQDGASGSSPASRIGAPKGESEVR
jgi:serine/threonine-protein kinase